MSNLDQIGKRTPYKVPEGFFESSADLIMARIEQEPRKALRRRFFTSFRAYAAAAAAAIILVLGSIFIFNESNHVSLNDLNENFMRLSSADRDQILDMYEDDLFLNL